MLGGGSCGVEKVQVVSLGAELEGRCSTMPLRGNRLPEGGGTIG